MAKRFQSPNPIWWILVPGAFIVLFLLGHYPNVVPFGYLGVLGNFLSSLVSNYPMFPIAGFWITIIAHVYEAIVARGICKKLKIDQTSTLLWTIQTFILGFPSLTILKGYTKQRRNK